MFHDRPPAADTGVPDATSLRTLLRATVRNADGEPLGRIEDAAIDAEVGTLVYVLLAFDDFTGVTKRFIIPWSALRVDPAGELVLDVDPEVLERAPGFAAVEPTDDGTTAGEPGGAALAGVGPLDEPHWRPRRTERFGR